MKRVAIFGASGCGRGVLPLARKQLEADNREYDLVFVDDRPGSELINGHQVLSYEEWLSQPASSQHINIAIANSVIRERLVERCVSDGVQFFQVRASNVVELDDVKIGDGAILCPFVTLTSNIRIG